MGISLIADAGRPLSPLLAWLLIDSSIKATALLATAFVTTWVLRRASAAVRDRIWVLAFCGATILPVVSSIVPQWRIPVAGIGRPSNIAPRPERSNVPFDQPNSIRSLDADPYQVETDMERESNSQAVADAGATARTLDREGRAKSDQPEMPRLAMTDSGRTKELDHSGTLLCVWLAGLVVLTIPFATALFVRGKLLGRCLELTDPVAKQLLEQASLRLGLARKVTLLQADDQTIPMTIGVVRPVVVIPPDWNTWPMDRLRLVMLHELAHIKRCDVLFQSIARVACALYWFNPLAWYALYRIRVDCELACDDHVIATGEPASAYASQLIEIARIYRPARFTGGIAMARSSKLEGRIVSLLDASRSHLPVSRKSGRRLLAVSTGAVLLLASTTLEKSTAVAIEPAVERPVKAAADLQVEKPEAAAAEHAIEDPDESDLINTIGQLRGVDDAKTGKQVPEPAAPKDVQNPPAAPAVNVANAQEPINAKPKPLAGMIALITTDSVLNELGIAKDSPEHLKILEVIKPFPTELNRRLNNPSDEDRLNRVTTQELYALVEAELVLELKRVLNQDQFTRLQQIHWQQWGTLALSDADLASKLEIKGGQQEKFASAKLDIENQRKALEKQRVELRDKGENIDEVQKKIQELESERTKTYNEILTPEQREKLVTLLGKPFEMPQPNRVSSGRRGLPIRSRPGGLMALALREPILKELGIDKDAPEVAEIRKLSETHSVELTRQLREMNPPENEKAKEIESKLQAKYDSDLKKLLTSEQFTRVRQINWQLQGMAALDEADVANTLEITKDQREQLTAASNEMFQKRVSLLNPQGGRPLGPVGEEVRAKIQELIAETEKKVNQILSQAQQEKFAELKGKPFDLTVLRAQN